MKFKGKEILAHLMKQRVNGQFQWFWINPITGSLISERFDNQAAADAWFEDLAESHNECFDLMNRLTNGKIYKVKAVVDFAALLSSTKICPFDVEHGVNTLSANILGLDLYDAKNRFREYFEVLEWIEND